MTQGTTTRYPAKPRGWGSMAYPTATGARRIQFMLSADDVDRLGVYCLERGLPSRAQAMRLLLAWADRKTGRPAGVGYLGLVAFRQRLSRGHGGGRAGPSARPEMVRWSQWMRPEDLACVERLMETLGLQTMSEVLRLAIRAARVSQREVEGERESGIAAGSGV